MAEEASVGGEGGEEPARKKPPILIIVVAICILAGGGAGVFVAAPALLGNPAEAASVDADGEAVAASGKHGAKEPAAVLWSVDNLVLNPSGTNGTRFLMVTATFELSDSKVVEQMKSREAEIRDLLIWTFGQRTVEELSDLQQRERLREDVLKALEERLHKGAVRRVYLPQFVIQ